MCIFEDECLDAQNHDTALKDSSYFNYCIPHGTEQQSKAFYYFQGYLPALSPFVSCVIMPSDCALCALDWTA